MRLRLAHLVLNAPQPLLGEYNLGVDGERLRHDLIERQSGAS